MGHLTGSCAICGRVWEGSVEGFHVLETGGVEEKNRLAFSVTTTTTSTIANFLESFVKKC